MDPFSPFITYFLEKENFVAAGALAGVVLLIVLLAFAWIRIADRRSRERTIERIEGASVQQTIVHGVRSKGDVTISPEQKNG